MSDVVEQHKNKFTIGACLLGAALLMGGGGYLYFKFLGKETQNRWSRTLQNWTGVDGTLDIYAGGKVVQRFIHVDKLTTGSGTDSGVSRPYRFGYGIWDKNLNRIADEDEPKVYFEISDYNGSYVFYASENKQ
jgi:hypothetical protein